MDELQLLKSIDKKLTALILLFVDLREQNAEKLDKSAPKVEVILKAAGFAAPEIARLVSKKPDAVRKALQRSK